MANIPKNPRSNCYFECKEGGPLHHFPKPHNDKERFDVWKTVLDHEIQSKTDMYIYNQIRLCNNHFESYYKSPSNRLTRNAVPTLYIKKDMPHPSTSTEVYIDSTPTAVVDQDRKTIIKKKIQKVGSCC